MLLEFLIENPRYFWFNLGGGYLLVQTVLNTALCALLLRGSSDQRFSKLAVRWLDVLRETHLAFGMILAIFIVLVNGPMFKDVKILLSFVCRIAIGSFFCHVDARIKELTIKRGYSKSGENYDLLQ